MTRLGSTADEIRALVPDALASWRYIRENVLERGVVDQQIKELCYRYLANDPEAHLVLRAAFGLGEQFRDGGIRSLDWECGEAFRNLAATAAIVAARTARVRLRGDDAMRHHPWTPLDLAARPEQRHHGRAHRRGNVHRR